MPKRLFTREGRKSIDFWGKTAKVIVVVAVAIAVTAIYWGYSNAKDIKNLQELSIVTANRHHDETTTQNKRIIQLQEENHTLLVEHSATFAENNILLQDLAVAGTDESLLATYLIDSQIAVCESTHATCPAPPSLQQVAAKP